MRHSKHLAAPIMPFLGLSHLDVFLGSQPFQLECWQDTSKLLQIFTASLRLEAPPGIIQSNPQLTAESPGAGCSGPCPAEFWVSSRMPTAQSLWGPYDRCSSLLIIFTALCCTCSSMSMFSSCGEPRTDHSAPTEVSPVLSKKEHNNLLWSPGNASLNAAQDAAGPLFQYICLQIQQNFKDMISFVFPGPAIRQADTNYIILLIHVLCQYQGLYLCSLCAFPK